MLVIVDLAVDTLIGITGRITTIHRIILTIGKHVITEKTLPRTCKGIRIDESADAGIIISALEVVEPGFSGVAVAVLIFTWIL